jgi:hypothetical protein
LWRPLIAFVEPCRARQRRHAPRARVAQFARENKYSSHGLPSCSARCKLVLHILLNPPGRPLALKPATLTPSVSDRAVAELRLQRASTADGSSFRWRTLLPLQLAPTTVPTETVNFFMISYAIHRHSDPTILCLARHRGDRFSDVTSTTHAS